MPARFFVPADLAEGEVIPLPADEARHLTRVLRLRVGAAVRVFNGHGAQFEATVESVASASVCVRLGERAPAAAEARVAVTVAPAILKGDKMDDVVRDAVMLGAVAIQPVITRRSEVTRAALTRGHRRERWERIAVSSAKQCGRAVVPPVLEPMPFEAVPAALRSVTLPSPAIMFVEPGASGGASRLADLRVPVPREATLLVGPEGGWHVDEIEHGASACHLATLGGRVLRADAMVTIALAALFAVWKEY